MATSQKRQFNGVFQNVSAGSASLTPAADGTETTGVASSIPVPGCSVGDVVFIVAPGSLGALQLDGEVQTAGTVVLKFANTTAGSLTPPAGVYTAICMTPDPAMFL
jgi:hypothetical protein